MRLSRLSALATLVVTAGRVSAQSTSIALTVPPGALTIATATAGSQLAGNTDQTARYSVTIVSGRMKITGQLDTPLPTGVTLSISLAAPSGAVSLGTVVLDGSPRDLVRYIGVGSAAGLQVTLSLTASVTAGVVPYDTSHVVLTLVDDP